MKELFEVSKAYENPHYKFPELILSSKYNLISGLFYLYAAFYILDFTMGGFINFFLFHIAMIILFIGGFSCLMKSYKYGFFKRYYLIKTYYKKTSYKLGNISRGKSSKDVHEYSLDFVTVPQNFTSEYTIKERINQIPKEKSGFFFLTDDLESAYRIIVNDEMYMFTDSFEKMPLFSSGVIEEDKFNNKLLNMKNIDILLVEYLPNGDFLSVSYEEKISGKIINLSRNIETSLENRGFYTSLYVTISMLMMPFFIYQHFINTAIKINFDNLYWHQLLTIGICIITFLAFIYYVTRYFCIQIK